MSIFEYIAIAFGAHIINFYILLWFSAFVEEASLDEVFEDRDTILTLCLIAAISSSFWFVSTPLLFFCFLGLWGIKTFLIKK